MSELWQGSVIIAAIGAGMMAGLYFIFSVAIMTALERLPPQVGSSAMQSINKVIVNPWFLTVFSALVSSLSCS